MNRGIWLAALGGLLAGGGLGFGYAHASAEVKARKKYEAYSASLSNAMAKVRAMPVEAPAMTEAELREVPDYIGKKGIGDLKYSSELGGGHDVKIFGDNGEEIKVGGEIVTASDGTMMTTNLQGPPPQDPSPTVNPYHTAVNATDVDVFVAGGVNDYGCSYIEEEEFEEEDGNGKHYVSIFMHPDGPIFTMDGDQIGDWSERIGASILVDFYRLVPPGADRVLYVRNHRTNEDYEVTQDMP